MSPSCWVRSNRGAVATEFCITSVVSSWLRHCAYAPMRSSPPSWCDWTSDTLRRGRSPPLSCVPPDGGRARYQIYCRAIDSGQYREVSVTESSRVLERTSGQAGDQIDVIGQAR